MKKQKIKKPVKKAVKKVGRPKFDKKLTCGIVTFYPSKTLVTKLKADAKKNKTNLSKQVCTVLYKLYKIN